jgi:hypothetical protein
MKAIIVFSLVVGGLLPNNRWSLNDYDKDGWKNMEHAEDRPFPTYTAAYEPETTSLKAVGITGSTIYLNLELSQLYRAKDKPYKRIAVDYVK